MRYEVELVTAQPQPIAAVAGTTTWEEFPRLWREMLDEVYSCLRAAGTRSGCNVMLYRDLSEAGRIGVQVGVEVTGPFPPSGRVAASGLPAGPAATTVHRGPYERLDAAHHAVIRWCAAEGLELTGERWEVCGDWREDPAELETRVFYRLRPAG